MAKKHVGTFQGKSVYAYTISNSNGVELTALNYGGAITELNVPDKNGVNENVIISYDDYALYEKNPYYLGVIVGRTAGRTADGKLYIDGETVSLALNDGDNHLHGGVKGLSKSFWNVTEENSALHFEYTSPDGEDDYPGNVKFQVTYQLTEDNQFIIDYHAETDKTTPINLTNHAYFNLSGDMKQDILDHDLQLGSNEVYVLDQGSIPKEKLNVEEIDAFNFKTKKKIKRAIESSEEQVALVGGGIDHPFLLDKQAEEKIVLTDDQSGRSIRVKTDDPAVVIYSANQIQATPLLNGGKAIKYAGICLETQEVPNQNESYLLNKDEIYEKRTVFHLRY
ncbi:aldose epimerase family protein [Salipaludibacillus sp. CF4.18]|uniref:aldose epimerase family protein n=1 Tax=Salipaludibacillus sp. CF4.18 TaxID=3373081 RepID=UPI003EE5E182